MRLKLVTALFGVLALTLGVRAADASAILIIDDPTTIGFDVTLADLGGTGAVSFNGAVGSFSINVVTGISKPAIGNPYSAEIDLNFVSVSSGAGNLAIYFLDTDFTLPNAPTLPVILTSNFGGTTSGLSVSSIGCIDSTNSGTVGAYPSQNCLSGGFAAPGAFSSSTGFSLPIGSGPFGLIQAVFLTHTAAGQVSSGDAHLIATVPEPGSLLLLGGGLLGLAGVVRRRLRARS